MKIHKRRRSYAPKTPVSVKSRGYKPLVIVEYSLVDMFAMQGQGNTQFEKAVDGCARSMGIFFDAYQYYVALGALESSFIDFVIYNPPTAIYADGIQHELRPDVEQHDMVRRNELEGMGWRVVAIKERDFLTDPQGQVGQILYG